MRFSRQSSHPEVAVPFGLAGVKWADEDMAEAEDAEVTMKAFSAMWKVWMPS